VALDYGKPDERFLSSVSLKEAGQYLRDGHFPSGSMGPKIEAAMQFVRHSGKRAVISSIEAIESAVRGKAGTDIH
jgi:carbamate kinase